MHGPIRQQLHFGTRSFSRTTNAKLPSFYRVSFKWQILLDWNTISVVKNLRFMISIFVKRKHSVSFLKKKFWYKFFTWWKTNSRDDWTNLSNKLTNSWLSKPILIKLYRFLSRTFDSDIIEFSHLFIRLSSQTPNLFSISSISIQKR